jgi:serine acetyltransferase
VGIGAVVRNNIQICGMCTVGAGAVVVENINSRGIYIGVPAREMV